MILPDGRGAVTEAQHNWAKNRNQGRMRLVNTNDCTADSGPV